MELKGVIFDFNGTLFLDAEKHNIAWKAYSKELRGSELTDEELDVHVHGRTNKAILEYILNKKFNDDSWVEFSDKKEKVYRDMCLKDKEGFKLTEGAEDLFDYLKANNIPFTIATGSEEVNVKFFIENFNLDKWFNKELIVFNDGTIKGKPDPDMYLKACKKLNLKPEECIVFEDSLSGIESAKRANIGKIIALSPKNKKTTFNLNNSVDSVISDFNTFDRSILK